MFAVAAPAGGQERSGPSLPASSPFLRGVPTGSADQQALPLSIADAINRALQHNLGVLESEQAVARAAGARRIALGDLLPNFDARASEVRQKINLEAFGLPLPGVPPLVGPFNVFDARLFLSQSVFDLRALNDVRAESHNLEAARFTHKSNRDLVVLVTVNLYLQALAASSRADTARAQLETAQALYEQAQDLKEGGIVAGIDVIRAEVRLATERQRATASENAFQKAKLQLARVVGLPIGQSFTLADEIPYAPLPEITMEQALERAYKARPDYQAALERMHAAEADRDSARGELLPSVRVNAEYGAIGLTVAGALPTFAVAGAVDIPIFQGGRVQGRIAQAEADVRNRRSEAEDLRGEIYYDVRTAFLDLDATREELQVATRARELAAMQLTQARDRFAAGVASNIEVVQAQEAVALAGEQYIGSLYGFNVSKAALARALGVAEEAVRNYLGGSNR
jgi:outer membrane protein TolC